MSWVELGMSSSFLSHISQAKKIFGDSFANFTDLIFSIKTYSDAETLLLEKIQVELANCVNKAKIDPQDAILFINCAMDFLGGSQIPAASNVSQSINNIELVGPESYKMTLAQVMRLFWMKSQLLDMPQQ